MEAKRQIWIHHGESATLWIGGVARWQRERVCVYYLFPSKPNGTLTFVGTRNKLIERERRMLSHVGDIFKVCTARSCL